MSIQVQIIPRVLHFKRPAGTSRGVLNERKVWYILLSNKSNPELVGYGECAPLPNLSCDDIPNYEEVLTQFAEELTHKNIIRWKDLRNYPSILFGFETALQHYQRQKLQLWDSPFARGEQGIPINGLIWMGSYAYMHQQIVEKIESGFKLIKLKIGAIDFEEEYKLLELIRKDFSADQIQLRVDANGAFSPEEALNKLERLARLDIHSIEQPIRAGQYQEMFRLTKLSPLPIALDEELIGHHSLEEKQTLLDRVKPQYIILKPSLHGGLVGCEEWIMEADKRGIGWWITSALESNIGLNAIAQWTATLGSKLPQGLGTGLLFTDNIEMPLVIHEDELWFNPNKLSSIQL